MHVIHLFKSLAPPLHRLANQKARKARREASFVARRSSQFSLGFLN